MFVGILRIQLALPAETLKEKRSIVRSVIERLRSKFNTAVAEVEDLDDPGAATIAAVCVSNAASHADSMMGKMANAIEGSRLDVVVISIETELMQA